MSSFTPTKVPQMHECRKGRKRRTYRKSNQRTHRTHTTKKHPEVSQCAQIQGFGLSKTTLQVFTYPTKHPEVSQCAKIQGFGQPKTTLQVSRCLPKPQTNTLQFPSLQNHPSKSRKVTKRPSKFPYTHEVREFLTIQCPNAPDQTPTPHPRSI